MLAKDTRPIQSPVLVSEQIPKDGIATVQARKVVRMFEDLIVDYSHTLATGIGSFVIGHGHLVDVWTQ